MLGSHKSEANEPEIIFHWQSKNFRQIAPIWIGRSWKIIKPWRRPQLEEEKEYEDKTLLNAIRGNEGHELHDDEVLRKKDCPSKETIHANI